MPTTHSRRHGFTLTELIVASSLTVGAFGIVALIDRAKRSIVAGRPSSTTGDG